MAEGRRMHNRLFNSDGLLYSDQYEQMNTVILPALEEKRQVKSVPGWNGNQVMTDIYLPDHPQGTVLILHGFTECAIKYAELIFSLLQHQYAVIAYDQRGHGRSWRKEGLENTSVTHVEHMDDYLEDLNTVCDTVLSQFPRPWMLFAHSMGGAVAAMLLESRHDIFDKAVLCAPMIAPNIGGVPKAAALALCRFFIAMNKGDRRVFFIQPYHGPEDFASSNATDKNRFAWYDLVKAEHPEYQNSCPTYRWTYESISVTNRLLAKGKPESITCPVLLYTAELDGSVLPEPQKAFADRIPNCIHHFVKDAKHEIYRSEDSVLFPWWHEILSFLKEKAV